MKKNLMLVGAFVASALVMTSCANCDEAVNKEKTACEEQLKAKDEAMAASTAEWQAKYDAAVATSDSLMMVIEEMNAPKTAATTKKATTTTTKTSTPDKAGSLKSETQTGGKLMQQTQSTGGKLKDQIGK